MPDLTPLPTLELSLVNAAFRERDWAGLYAAVAHATAFRAMELREMYNSGTIDRDEYDKLLDLASKEDKLLTSACKNLEKGSSSKPAQEVVDYGAKLKALS